MRKLLNVFLFFILFLLLIIKYKKETHFPRENFYPVLIPIQNADPLELEKDKFNLYPKSGWILGLEGKVFKIIKIKAIVGQIDFENVMAFPVIGFHQNGGLNYDYQNKSEGTNMHFYQNQARHGNRGYYQWFTTKKWNSLSDEKKRMELDIKIVIDPNQINKPRFPVSFAIQVPDFNYNKSFRVWVILYGNPIPTKNEINFIPPLRLKFHKIIIPSRNWNINNKEIAITRIPLNITQGEIDENLIMTNSNINWFLKLENINSNMKYFIIFKIPKKDFKNDENIKFRIKDKNYNQNIFFTVILKESPFDIIHRE